METPYIAIGENGLFKVGRTTQFEKRLHGLKQSFRLKGDVIARHHAFAPVRNGYAVESRLMTWAGKAGALHSGREWFTGINFEDALVEGARIREACKDAVPFGYGWTPEQRAAWAAKCEQARRESAERRRLHLEWVKRSEADRARRRRLRETGLHSFDAMVEAVISSKSTQAV